jgi:AraC-like DNA-binding protein
MADLRLFALHQFDPLVAESAVQTRAVPASLDLVHRPAGSYKLEVHGFVRGPLSVEETCCTDGTRMRLPSEDPGYVVSFSVRGAMLAVHRGRELDLGPGRAVMFQPPAEMIMTTKDDFDVVIVRVDAVALEDALEARLGYPVRRPLPLTLDLGTAAGRGWAELVRHVLRCAVPGGPLTNPVIAEPLQDSLLDGLLRASDHPYREALDAPVRSWGPSTVRRGVDTIEAFPQRPFTMAGLAADAGVSVPVLQECWQRHRGVRPMRYLQQVRLTCAHHDLDEHAPGETTVAATVAVGIRAAGTVHDQLRRALRAAPWPDPARAGVRLNAPGNLDADDLAMGVETWQAKLAS